MKKINYLGLVGLGCGALLLSGCGGNSHTLKCEITSDNQKQVIEIEFNKEETKAENVFMEMTMEVDSTATDEQIEQSKEALKAGCEAAGYSKCKATSSGKKITYSFETEASQVGIDTNGTIDEVKKQAEEDGFTCK